MEILTLATTALTLAKPFLEKIGEGTSRKIGEDIWNLIKKPFQRKEKEIDKLSIQEIEEELVEILKEDTPFKEELESFVINAQSQIDSVTQNIQNIGKIDKQVNIGSNIGNISL